MSVSELHRPRPLGLLKLVQQRQWPALALALENGAPAHAVVGLTRLNLFEEFMKEAYKQGREPRPNLALAQAEERLRDQVFEAFVASWKGNDPERPTPLTLATLMGNTRWVRLLLEAGHDPNETGEGHSPVSALARRNLQGPVSVAHLRGLPEQGWDEAGATQRSACLDALLAAGADLNRPAWRGACPLLLACLAKDTPMVLALLARKANPEGAHAPDAPGIYRLSPLEAAIVTHNETAVAALLRAGANPLRSQSVQIPPPVVAATLVEVAGGMGQAGMLSALADRLGDRHHPELVKAWWFSLIRGNDEVVEWFLSHGRKWNETDEVGRQPIHVAAAHAHRSLIERLEQEGASLDDKDAHGHTGWDFLQLNPGGMALKASLALRNPPLTAEASNVLMWRPRNSR